MSAALPLQPSSSYVTSVATTNGPANETRPILTDGSEALAEVIGIYFSPGQEGQHDRREPGEELQPFLIGVEIEEVARDHAQAKLDSATERPSSTEIMLAATAATTRIAAS